jgi:hypothetical protein
VTKIITSPLTQGTGGVPLDSFGRGACLAYAGDIDLPSNGAPADWPSIGLFLFVLLGVAALIFWLPTALTRTVSRRLRKIPTLNDDWVIRLSNDGMFSSSKRGEGRLDWSGFSGRSASPTASCCSKGPICFAGFPTARAPSRRSCQRWTIW